MRIPSLRLKSKPFFFNAQADAGYNSWVKTITIVANTCNVEELVY